MIVHNPLHPGDCHDNVNTAMSYDSFYVLGSNHIFLLPPLEMSKASEPPTNLEEMFLLHGIELRNQTTL